MEELAQVKVVARDRGDSYMAATKACVPKVDKKVVFDRFQVMRHVLEPEAA